VRPIRKRSPEAAAELPRRNGLVRGGQATSELYVVIFYKSERRNDRTSGDLISAADRNCSGMSTRPRSGCSSSA
jgi:hypothetical protein